MKKDKIKTILTRGVEEVIVEKNLKERLESGKKLRIKFGIDPTSPDIHLGHTVVLRKLKQFQDMGHKIVLIIGEFTAQVGDPSGRDKTRPTLTAKEVKENYKNYLKQASKVIDIKKSEIRKNSEWYGKSLDKVKKGFMNVVNLTESISIQQILKREDFQKRLKEESSISILETLYPILQGYDSVEVKADVELGGTDQKFNLLMGREVQKRFNMKEQDIITVPLIEGTDGKIKMSKSKGNYIGVSDSPRDMFGKVMSIPDNLIDKYFENLTDKNRPTKDPYESKLSLAEEIVSTYHSQGKASKAREEFKQVFSEGNKPENMEDIKIKDNINIINLLIKTGIKSKNEAKRLVEQGAIKVDDKKITDFSKSVDIKNNQVLQVGKKKFYKLLTK
ncbi:MAG: tyrosine--tRNA ligase [Candidatus Paceibacterota bacterium]